MDIRDIKEEPRVIDYNRYLEEMYRLQKSLIDHYINIEGLPPYPVNVNSKESQVLLKDFTGRVTEELAEGYESHVLVQSMIEKVGMNIDLMEEEEYNKMISHLQNLNEEIADAVHFMLELFIYANIYPADILGWIAKKHQEEYGVKLSTDPDILNMAMNLGFSNIMTYYSRDLMVRGVNLAWGLGDKDIDNILRYIPGGRDYSSDLIDNSRKVLWDITYALGISRNCLKNKPWKQSGVMTNEVLYQSKLVEAFVYMMGYCKLLGMTSSDIYYLYFKKNKVNQFRIESKY